MFKGITIIYLSGLNKGFGSKFHIDTRVRQETPEEGRRIHRREDNNEDSSPNTLNDKRACPRGVRVIALNCGIVVSEFEPQSRYYVHFRTNTLEKCMNPLITPNYGLNSISAVLLERRLWH